jgi:hypothetical protein
MSDNFDDIIIDSSIVLNRISNPDSLKDEDLNLETFENPESKEKRA